MKYVVDARGLACPLPVVNTKKQIEVMQESDVVEVLVDNEIAVQNLTKFAKQKNYQVQATKKNEDCYEVCITPVFTEGDAEVEETVCIPDGRKGNLVVVISGNTMGSGEEKLGKALMKAFIFALTKQDQLPKTILLFNSGAYFSCEGSESLEDLQLLQAQGVEILTCGTCLDFYGLTEKLQVGSITNMYEIVEKMEQADKIVRP